MLRYSVGSKPTNSGKHCQQYLVHSIKLHRVVALINYMPILCYLVIFSRFHNCTATPEEPYPVIQGCVTSNGRQAGKHQCTLPVVSTVSITCSVSGYFPSINLSFLHKSSTVVASETKEWTNADGTKGSYITINASVSEALYVCEMSSIPGKSKNYTRRATVLVELQSDIVTSTVPHAATLELTSSLESLSNQTYWGTKKTAAIGNNEIKHVSLPCNEMKGNVDIF